MKNCKLLVYLTSILTIWLNVVDCKAQSPEKNLLKYWYYHDRLLNDFMSCVCYENGGSMPASIRNNRGTDPNLSWGDGTIDLSYYIGTLALEHYLLSTSGESTNETDKELFYAINAINRLDMNVDLVLSTGENYVNGFIARDDVGLNIGYIPKSDATVIHNVNSNNPYPTQGHPLIEKISSDAMSSADHLRNLQILLHNWALHPGSGIGALYPSDQPHIA